jgi:hypothetical protein
LTYVNIPAKKHSASSAHTIEYWPIKFTFRNDGIITAITVWQVLIELVIGIGIIIYVRVFLNHYLFLDRLLLIFISAIHFVVLPAFFLLADQSFRNSVRIHGGLQALWMLVRNWKYFHFFSKKQFFFFFFFWKKVLEIIFLKKIVHQKWGWRILPPYPLKCLGWLSFGTGVI